MEAPVVPNDLDPQLMQRLVVSRPWQDYVEWLLIQFDQTAQRLDQTDGDHRFVQGLKHGLRLALETPYRAAGMDSPLARLSPRRPRRVKRPETETPPEDDLVAIRRRSFLA
jgi:hypothetical protein